MFDGFLNTFFYLFAFVFVLSVVVLVHEWGHFIVARLCGVKVTHFSLGFGRVLWHRTDKKGTQWQVCLWPLGGYVKMLGDEDAASAKTDTSGISKEELKYTFMAQPLYKRAAVIFAGPAMNYIFAIIVMTGMLFFVGRGMLPPVIGSFLEESPAQTAGMQVGDRITEMNGHPVTEWMDIQRIVRILEFEKTVDVTVDRNGETLSFVIKPIYYPNTDDMPKIGIASNPSLFFVDEKVGLWEAFTESVESVAMITKDTFVYLGQVLLNNRKADGMRGPLGIAEMSGDAMKGGLLSLLGFIVNISVAVGFMNLLPIPLLDGGHLFFYAVEAVIRKPLPQQIQNALLWGGMSILFGLLLFTMYLDIPRIIQRILG